MEQQNGEEGGQSPSGQVALASMIGTAIEWYDFFIYGTAAALVFGQLFFPGFSPLAGTLAAFATFGAGFVARPIGGVVFGHFGDRVGRKPMLVVTILSMGVATFLIGVLPTYGQVGILAPVLLVVLRLVQGFSVGGEWGGAALMTVEHAPRNRRGYYGSWTMVGSPAGLLLATVVFTAFSGLPDEQFLSWGWRVPFLFSILLIGVGMFVRLKVLESPAFVQEVKETRTEARTPLLETLRTHPREALLAVGINLGFNMFIFVLFTFMLSYGTEQLGLQRGLILSGTLIGAAVMIVSILVFAALSDRIGRRPVMLAGAAFLVLYSFPLFWLVDTANSALVLLAMVIGFFGSASIFGPMAAFIVESFTTRVRYTGASLGYQMGAVLGGGLSPFIATALLALSGGNSWTVSAYLFAGALVSLISIYLLSETFSKDLSEARPTEPRTRVDEEVTR